MKRPIVRWLKTVKCPLCDSSKVRRDFDFPKTMKVCENCGCEFNTAGDITLDPKQI